MQRGNQLVRGEIAQLLQRTCDHHLSSGVCVCVCVRWSLLGN